MSLKTRIIIGIGLIGTGAATKAVLAHQVSAMRVMETEKLERKLAEFPQRLGDWSGADIPPDETLTKVITDIKASDYLNRTYVHSSGERVSLWFNYSDRSLDQYHYPTVCLTGAGWDEDESQRKVINVDCTAATRPVTNETKSAANIPEKVRSTPIVHFYFSRGPEQQVVHYWYYIIGEDPIDRSMRRLSSYARVFLRGRQNPSLTVEIFSQSASPNMSLIDDFAGLVAKELSGWMPKGTEASAELGATY